MHDCYLLLQVMSILLLMMSRWCHCNCCLCPHCPGPAPAAHCCAAAAALHQLVMSKLLLLLMSGPKICSPLLAMMQGVCTSNNLGKATGGRLVVCCSKGLCATPPAALVGHLLHLLGSNSSFAP